MNIVIILAILAAIVIVSWFWNGHSEPVASPGTFCLGCIIGLAVLVIGSLSTMISYSSQLSDAQELIKLRGVQEVRLTQATALTEEFRQALTEKYPEHEKAIFQNFKPQNLLVYLATYPQLRALDGMQDLVKRTQDLWSGYYYVQEQQQALLAEMRYRAINPWLFNWFIPDPPE